MLNQSWFRNQNNVVCCRKEEVLPKLARELAIPDLSQRCLLYTSAHSPQVGSIGGEWAVLGLARSGYDVPDSYYQDYYATVEAYVLSLIHILYG